MAAVRSISGSVNDNNVIPPPNGTDTVEAPFDNADGPVQNRSGARSQTKFQARRTATQGLYDVALLMANVSQLKSVLDVEEYKYQTVLIALLGTSISLHLLCALMLYGLLITEKYIGTRQRLERQIISENDTTSICTNCSETATCTSCKRILIIDCVATACVFFVTVLNVFITAFGSNIHTQDSTKISNSTNS